MDKERLEGGSDQFGVLAPTEPHPAAYAARKWIVSLPADRLCMWREAFASTAIEGNRVGEICGETLRRLMAGEPVSDRYLLGLAWVMKETE
jgi:hypothetical protein